jgi:hypothetical protein
MYIHFVHMYTFFPHIFHEQGQGCQMVSFQTKNPNLGIFWETLEWKMLLYIMYGNL